MIFIDSDAYLALNIEEDSNHKKAERISRENKDVLRDTVTSWDVVDEVSTKLSYFQTHARAIEFLNDIIASETRIEYVNPFYASIAKGLFVKQTSKKVSLTDCTNMVIAKQRGIKTFFSFDHHYEQNGFVLLAKDS